jgi:hypothetical protein
MVPVYVSTRRHHLSHILREEAKEVASEEESIEVDKEEEVAKEEENLESVSEEAAAAVAMVREADTPVQPAMIYHNRIKQPMMMAWSSMMAMFWRWTLKITPRLQ